jgi:hypothetical protein
VLCLLYRQRVSNHEAPGLSILDLEEATGCTREELTSALWYLCQKEWAKLGEFTAYSITAEGFEAVESKLEDRLEFRALATWSYYGSANPEPRSHNQDVLPLDIAPVIGAGEDVFVADHYEILGIGPRADEEAIERVYRTLQVALALTIPVRATPELFCGYGMPTRLFPTRRGANSTTISCSVRDTRSGFVSGDGSFSRVSKASNFAGWQYCVSSTGSRQVSCRDLRLSIWST